MRIWKEAPGKIRHGWSMGHGGDVVPYPKYRYKYQLETKWNYSSGFCGSAWDECLTKKSQNRMFFFPGGHDGIIMMASWRTTCDRCKYYQDLDFELEENMWCVNRFKELHLVFFDICCPFCELAVTPICKEWATTMVSASNTSVQSIYYLKASRCFVYST